MRLWLLASISTWAQAERVVCAVQACRFQCSKRRATCRSLSWTSIPLGRPSNSPFPFHSGMQALDTCTAHRQLQVTHRMNSQSLLPPDLRCPHQQAPARKIHLVAAAVEVCTGKVQHQGCKHCRLLHLRQACTGPLAGHVWVQRLGRNAAATPQLPLQQVTPDGTSVCQPLKLAAAGDRLLQGRSAWGISCSSGASL